MELFNQRATHFASVCRLCIRHMFHTQNLCVLRYHRNYAFLVFCHHRISLNFIAFLFNLRFFSTQMNIYHYTIKVVEYDNQHATKSHVTSVISYHVRFVPAGIFYIFSTADGLIRSKASLWKKCQNCCFLSTALAAQTLT